MNINLLQELLTQRSRTKICLVKVVRCSFLICSMAFSMSICILRPTSSSSLTPPHNTTKQQTSTIAKKLSLYIRSKKILSSEDMNVLLRKRIQVCWNIVIVTLYMYSKNASIVNEYQILKDLFSHFLYKLRDTTSLNCCKRILPMFWILKKSCTRLGLTWSNSTNLHITQKQNEQMWGTCTWTCQWT